MIAGINFIRLTPWIAIAALLAGGAWLFNDHRDQAVEISQLEAKLAERAAEIRTLEEEAAAVIRQHAEDLAALEAELARQSDQAERFRAARDTLDGLEDGAVAPVLRGAMDALP